MADDVAFEKDINRDVELYPSRFRAGEILSIIDVLDEILLNDASGSVPGTGNAALPASLDDVVADDMIAHAFILRPTVSRAGQGDATGF